MINLELKKGMYIRTNKGKIGKIIKQIDNSGSLHHNNYVWLLDNGDVLALHSNKVKNASFNLIDLIKVGDYVNGYKVEEVNNNLNEHKGICNCLDTYLWCVNELDKFEEIVIFENDIKSVVTKEQFESCKYVIERNNDEK